MNINNQRYDVTLAANEVRQMSVSGQFFFCVAASVPFGMSIDGGGQIAVQAGLAFPTDTEFSRLVLQDTSGSGCVLSFYAASLAVQFFPPTTNTFTKDAPTYTKGTALGAMAGGASTTFNGLDGGKVRKQIVVTNNDAALVVAVTDNAGVRLGTVYPQRPWTLATSGIVKVTNQNGGALTGTVDVGETFYQ